MLLKKVFLTFLLFTILNCFSQTSIDSLKPKSFPIIENYINDFEKLLEFHQKELLKTSVKSFEEKTNQKIIFVSTETIEPYDNIFDYSLNLANSLNFKCDVVIVVCNNLKQIQIQNNDRVSEKLTNEETKEIIENEIIPFFKKGKHFKGLLRGISKIKEELQ